MIRIHSEPATLTAAARSRGAQARRLGRVRLSALPAGKRTVKVTLKPRVRRALREGKRIRARLIVRVDSPGASSLRAERRLFLR